MFFRFGSAIILVVSVSLAGTTLEKKNLDLQRKVSRQHYRLEVLLDRHAELRLKTQELGAPSRLFPSLEKGKLKLHPPEKAEKPESRRRILLQWQRPTPLP